MKKISQPIGKAVPKLAINQRISQPAIAQAQTHRRLSTASKSVIALLLGMATLISAGYEVFGPPWPISPVFSPGPPSFGAAFDIPFAVENRSAFFPIENLNIICVVTISLVGSSNGSPPQINHVGINVGGTPKTLATALSQEPSVGTYRCPLRGVIGAGRLDVVDQVKSAQISFHSEYDMRVPWHARTQSDDGPFTLVTTTVPPHWTRGNSLN
jgi:hypothetical protein